MDRELLEGILNLFPKEIEEHLKNCCLEYGRLEEIRMRARKPLLLSYDNREYYVGTGGLTRQLYQAVYCTEGHLKETVERLSRYSLYAYQEEIRQGFLTLAGGHRAGVTGRVTVEDGTIRNMKYIASLNLRVAHEVKGCAESVVPYLCSGDKILPTLIISPPGCGKTTLLRDVIRMISNGTKERPGKTVGVVDERSELGASYLGIPQNDLGIRTDLLDCCPKAAGMHMLIRSMAPDVVAVDEIGLREDITALQYAMGCGCSMIGTIHGTDLEELKGKPWFAPLIREKWFGRYVVLSRKEGPGTVEMILDEKGVRLDC